MPLFDDFVPMTTSLPTTALCLRVPGTGGEELVVHRNPSTNEDYVYLFEALDDADDYSRQAEKALGFRPDIGRVRVADLDFRTARFKPAVGAQVDIPIQRFGGGEGGSHGEPIR